MGNLIFQGSAVALVTPMNDDYSVNYTRLEELIEYQIEQGTDAILVTGTTGEASTLSTEEHVTVIKRAVSYVQHRVPVIAGTGSNNTQHAMELSKMAEDCGVDALLHVTPYYNKTSQRGLVEHFIACADATNLPVILYNIPSRTGVNILPETYEYLCENNKIVAVKEASGDFSQIAKIAALYGDRITIYTGNDDQIAPSLSLGGKGVISVLANVVPKVTHDICYNYFNKNNNNCKNLQLKYLDLINALFSDVNPIPVKQALKLMGKDAGPCRLPLYLMDDKKVIQLKQVLYKHGLCPSI